MKALLLALCCASAVAVVFFTADIFGIGERPWYGWWDGTFATSAAPFVVKTIGVNAGGASDRSGLRTGDLVDLRSQPLQARVTLPFQLPPWPVALVVNRGSQTLTLQIQSSTVMDGPYAIKIAAKALSAVAFLWFSACALLIVLRRSDDSDARDIATIMLLQTAWLLRPGAVFYPSVAWGFALGTVSHVSLCLSAFLLLRLVVRHAKQSPAVRIFARIAAVTILLELLRGLLGYLGLATLWYDPLPYLSPLIVASGVYPAVWNSIQPIEWASIACLAAIVVAQIPTETRARKAWLLLPLPLTLGLQAVVSGLLGLANSCIVFMVLLALVDACNLLCGVVVTYALLRKRVLDLGFVMNRTLVVATISLIVAASFILLEWALGSTLADVNHITGVVAGGALALGLGLSMRYIHARVELGVDVLFFRKRHNDERALLEFSKEAAYVTDADALLDHAIEKLRAHTDARGAALLLRDGAYYEPARTCGQHAAARVDENDAMVLALKTWHKPIDPHHYESAERGALAIPMLARGDLLGIILLDERSGGEAYAPDEIEALAQFAHGVGSAYDALRDRRAMQESAAHAIALLTEKIDRLIARSMSA